MAGTVRKTREERREQALVAAREEFARAGMQASVDLVAERAGVTASYLLRLFGTKKALFIAVVERAFDHTLSQYEQATKNKTGSDALEAVATTRRRLNNDDRVTTMIQLQAFAACDDEEIREAASVGYGRIVEFVQAASDASPNELARFLADGAHHRILAAMHMTTGLDRPAWARLLEEVGRNAGRKNAGHGASFGAITTNPAQSGGTMTKIAIRSSITSLGATPSAGGTTRRTRLTILGACILATAGLVASTAGVAAAAPTCTDTGFRGLTAAKIGGKVTGNVDATGCDIGVYYGPGATGSVNKATITNAKYFGVVNHDGNVDVKNSTISKIGNTPFDGSQHGVGILYTTEELPYESVTGGTAKGTISGNVVRQYQKGGITVRGVGASATIQLNTVIGSGKVDYIAQNGIQVSFGGSATVKGNIVSGNYYTPTTNEACGLLLYQAGEVKQQGNLLFGNEANVYIV